MFRNDYSFDQQWAQERAVNTKEHLSNMSPSEIVDEMENIFLDNESGDMDVDQLLSYLDYLDEVAPINESFDAESSYFQFSQNHAALIAETRKLNQKRPIHRLPVAVRRIGLVAVMLVLIIGVGSAVYASSTPFAQWVNETFSFDSTPTGVYTSLQEALDDYNVKEQIVPDWLPQEYIVSEVSVNETTAFKTFFAQYNSVVDESHHLTITILNNSSGRIKTIHEKGPEIVDSVTSGVNTYYISHDNGETSIMWKTNAYECSISGIIADEDIFKIIDSIE